MNTIKNKIIKAFNSVPEKMVFKSPRRVVEVSHQSYGRQYPGTYEDFKRGVEPTEYYVDHKLLRDYYRKSGWVRASVDAIVSEMIARGWEFYSTDKKREQPRIISFLTGFLKKPNKDQTGEELIRIALNDWLVTGDAYWEVVRDNETNAPLELYPIDAASMEIKIDRHGLKKGYVQKVGGEKEVRFSVDDIIHWAYQPMSNNVYGLSPLETLLQTAAGDLNARDYNNLFFKNNATPRLHIDLGEGADRQSVLEFREYLEEKLKGKPFKNIITGGGAIIREISISNRDMEYSEFQKMNAQKILSVYGVPPIQIGMVDASNRFNAEEQRQIWKETRIQPLQRAFANGINRLIEYFGFKKIRFRFIGFDKKDPRKEMEIASMKLKQGLITINEWRREQGLEPVEWGDEPLLLQTKGSPGSEGQEGLEVHQEPDKTRDITNG